MKPKYWVVLGVAAVGAIQAGGCTKFHDCNDTRTCGVVPESSAGQAGMADASGGSAGVAEGGSGNETAAGAAGDAGAAGAAPIRECEHDYECANPDTDTCIAACMAMDGGTRCVVHGKDKDQDGYYSKDCVASPGDDCDDTSDAVHPGAKEMCDGIDNDCNGKIDVSDGVAVSGSNIILDPSPAAYARIAFAPDRSVLGVAILNRDTGGVSTMIVGNDGHIIGAAEPITSLPPEPPEGVAFIWGASSFGLAYVGPADGPALSVASIASDGTILGRQVLVRASDGLQGAALARVPFGTWFAFSENNDNNLLFGTSTDLSDPSATHFIGKILTGVDHVRVGTSGTNVLIAYDDLAVTDGNSAAGMLDDQAGPPVASLKFSGRHPVVGSSESFFGVAVSGATNQDSPLLYGFSTNGKPQCPAPINLGDPAQTPAAITPTSLGALVTLVGPSGVVVQEVNFDCSLGQRFTLDPRPPLSDAFIVSTNSGYGAVWTAANGVNFRAFGQRFCD